MKCKLSHQSQARASSCRKSIEDFLHCLRSTKMRKRRKLKFVEKDWSRSFGRAGAHATHSTRKWANFDLGRRWCSTTRPWSTRVPRASENFLQDIPQVLIESHSQTFLMIEARARENCEFLRLLCLQQTQTRVLLIGLLSLCTNRTRNKIWTVTHWGSSMRLFTLRLSNETKQDLGGWAASNAKLNSYVHEQSARIQTRVHRSTPHRTRKQTRNELISHSKRAPKALLESF